MRWSDFIFDLVQLLYYKCHRINFRHAGSYIESPDWIKDKKATATPTNKDDNWFQYAIAVALNYEEIKWNPERVSNIKSFLNKYNWKGIDYLSKIDNWKTFEKNNPTISLNILYFKEKEKCTAYNSKINSNYEK